MQIPKWPPISFQSIKKTDLGNMYKLLKSLGNPHLNAPPVIHVAGTNGKGSSVAMLKSIFNAAGYSTHTYTSPHLLEFNERIVINDQKISDAHIDEILFETKLAAEKAEVTPTFFEGITAAAFLAFSRCTADILLLETGIGGRLDCTNVIPKPLATIITPISLDHQNYLGNTMVEIAREKAGIIKENVPCIIGPQSPEVYDLLLEICDEKSAPSFCYEYDYFSNKNENGFTYLSQKFNLDFPVPNLRGDHQITNAASVIAAIMLINEKYNITKSHIIQGLQAIEWPGRIQKISAQDTKKLTGTDNITIYIDGAHNDAGARGLAEWAFRNVDGCVYIILGMTRGRDIITFCKNFRNLAHYVVTVKVESEPSSYSAEYLHNKINNIVYKSISAKSLTDAIDILVNDRKPFPATIIITGSLFLISDFLKLIS